MAHHALFGQLAASLVYAVTDYWEPEAGPARAGALLYDLSQSGFENARDMVARLGLATDGRGSAIHRWAVEMKLSVDADKVADFVMERSRDGQAMPPIDDLIAAWILCAHHWDVGLTERVPFTPSDNSRLAMDALAEAGYAKPLGSAFVWTDKIGPAMRMSGFWDENNLSFEELEKRDADLDMRRALASIPEDVRHSALRGDTIAVAKALALRWVDGAWLSDVVGEGPWYGLAGAADSARQLVQLVKSADDPPTHDVN